MQRGRFGAWDEVAVPLLGICRGMQLLNVAARDARAAPAGRLDDDIHTREHIVLR